MESGSFGHAQSNTNATTQPGGESEATANTMQPMQPIQPVNYRAEIDQGTPYHFQDPEPQYLPPFVAPNVLQPQPQRALIQQAQPPQIRIRQSTPQPPQPQEIVHPNAVVELDALIQRTEQFLASIVDPPLPTQEHLAQLYIQWIDNTLNRRQRQREDQARMVILDELRQELGQPQGPLVGHLRGNVRDGILERMRRQRQWQRERNRNNLALDDRIDARNALPQPDERNVIREFVARERLRMVRMEERDREMREAEQERERYLAEQEVARLEAERRDRQFLEGMRLYRPNNAQGIMADMKRQRAQVEDDWMANEFQGALPRYQAVADPDRSLHDIYPGLNQALTDRNRSMHDTVLAGPYQAFNRPRRHLRYGVVTDPEPKMEFDDIVEPMKKVEVKQKGETVSGEEDKAKRLRPKRSRAGGYLRLLNPGKEGKDKGKEDVKEEDTK